MLKRTKGRLLLTLLVVTGFAGTLTTSSLSSKERKVIVVALKENKTELFKNIRSLSARQLRQPIKGKKWTIEQSFAHLVAEETIFWKQFETAMLQPAKPENRSEITLEDEDILKNNFSADQCVNAPNAKASAEERSMLSILNEFKSSRSKQLKYIKTTTEDLRNRVVNTPIGPIDCYQLLLYITLHSNAHLDEIELAQAQPGFSPKKP